MSSVSASLAGIFSAATPPSTKATARTCHSSILSERISTASSDA